mgnify:CR=1 FL=1
MRNDTAIGTLGDEKDRQPAIGEFGRELYVPRSQRRQHDRRRADEGDRQRALPVEDGRHHERQRVEGEWKSFDDVIEVVEDLVWYYRYPTMESAKIANHLCFPQGKVEMYVDGVLEPKPNTRWD